MQKSHSTCYIYRHR